MNDKQAEMEVRLRQRRVEILMAGNGIDEGMSEREAREIAKQETVEEILDADGDHLAETDPDLIDWFEQ